MHDKPLRTLALLAGLGLLPACPNETTVDTTTDGTGTSTTTDGDPDPSLPTTTTNTTPPDDTTTAATDTDATTGPTTGPTTTEDPTTGDVDGLCGRLGGMEPGGIPALVAAFVGQLLVDDKVNGYFLNSDVDGEALAGCITDQLGALAGCAGVVYGCQDMAAAHAGLGISQLDFDDFVVDFFAAYDEHAAAHPALTDGDRTAIGEALAAMAGDIVEDPNNDLTLYQRVGRKPAIEALIGHPGEAQSFLDNVAMDPAIAGFFLMTEFDRSNTCLTRQLSGIDGPVAYGLEVTAPDGVDPGVTGDDPCKDMKTAHAGLQDEMMEGITLDDFLAVVVALVDAMNAAAIDPKDQDVILAALGPMCDDIVAEPNTCPGNTRTELLEAVDLKLPIDNMAVNGQWDDKYDGGIDSMLCIPLEIADDGVNIITDVRLKIGLDHTWIGDVTIKLVAPDGTLLTVLSRPTIEDGDLLDDGVDCCGDESDASADHPLTFTDAAKISGKTLGLDLENDEIVCKDEGPKIDPCELLPYPGGGPGGNFGDFAGLSPVGTWNVCVGDSGLGDFGALRYIGLSIDKIKYAP